MGHRILTDDITTELIRSGTDGRKRDIALSDLSVRILPRPSKFDEILIAHAETNS
jgi:hypothetical protein